MATATRQAYDSRLCSMPFPLLSQGHVRLEHFLCLEVQSEVLMSLTRCGQSLSFPLWWPSGSEMVQNQDVSRSRKSLQR